MNEVVFWNVRTGDVTCDAPDNVNMDELRQVMSTDLLDVEMEVLKFLLKVRLQLLPGCKECIFVNYHIGTNSSPVPVSFHGLCCVCVGGGDYI